jgi:hypothetical protein
VIVNRAKGRGDAGGPSSVDLMNLSDPTTTLNVDPDTLVRLDKRCESQQEDSRVGEVVELRFFGGLTASRLQRRFAYLNGLSTTIGDSRRLN